jgi:hypothetical protein
MARRSQIPFIMRNARSDERRIRATVWAAEHGASSLDLDLDAESLADDDSPANVGHRFRIHGRLEESHASAPPAFPEPGMKLDPEFLRRLVARETEVDVRDVQIDVQREQLVLRGTVGDEGERVEIETLLARIPGIQTVQNLLRVQTS